MPESAGEPQAPEVWEEIRHDPKEDIQQADPYMVLLLKIIKQAMDDLRPKGRNSRAKNCYQIKSGRRDNRIRQDATAFLQSQALEYYLQISGLHRRITSDHFRRLAAKQTRYGHQLTSILNEQD